MSKPKLQPKALQTGQTLAPEQQSHGNLRSYTIGFLLSLALTLEAYLLVVHHTFSAVGLTITVLILAIVQLLVQLFFFLHLDRSVRAPWNIIIFMFMGMIVSIVVFGSLWIMHNLNYQMKNRMQSPGQSKKYMKDNEGL